MIKTKVVGRLANIPPIYPARITFLDVFGEDIRAIKFFRFTAFPFMGRMLNIAHQFQLNTDFHRAFPENYD